MFKRIDLFRPVQGKLDLLHHFTEKLAEALKSIGVKSRVLLAEYNNPKPFLEQIMEDRPDCTLCFNGLLPDSQGRFFCDMIKVPHVACLIDSPVNFIPLTGSDFNIITCPDKFSKEFLRGLNFQNTIFLPHGVDKNITASSGPRPYDVVMLSPLIDYLSIRESWDERFGPVVAEAMEEVAETVLMQPEESCIQVLVQIINKYASEGKDLDPSKMNFIEILSDIEVYVKGKDRIALLHSIKDTEVHIFGDAAETATWSKYLEDDHYIIHDPVPFEKAIEIMKQSKIVLSSNAWMKSGVHFMTLYGLMAGALVLTHENHYLHEFFIDRESIAYYNYGELEKVPATINAYLNDETLRWETALHGREEVLQRHTWDERAKNLVQQLDSILAAIATE